MRKRRLGTSDLEVTEISLGSWLTYSGGVEREHTEACTRAAFDAGINFFDTANVYGNGASETRLGRDPQRLSRATTTSSRRRSTSRSTAAAGSPRSRSTSRSTPRWSVCRPTTSTSTSATASTSRRRSRRRWRRSPTSSRPARRAASASASGPRSRSRPGSRRRPTASPSSPPSRSTRCSGVRPRTRCSRSAPSHGISQIVWSPLAEGVLSGKYEPGRPPPGGLARGERRDELVHRAEARPTRRSRPSSGCGRSPTRPGSRWSSSRSPGCCAATSSPRRSSARAGPSRSTRTSPPPRSSSTSDLCDAIDDALGGVPVTRNDPGAGRHGAASCTATATESLRRIGCRRAQARREGGRRRSAGAPPLPADPRRQSRPATATTGGCCSAPGCSCSSRSG